MSLEELFGPDPVMAAVAALNERGAKRAAELAAGFTTRQKFDSAQLFNAYRERSGIRLVSAETDTEYDIVPVSQQDAGGTVRGVLIRIARGDLDDAQRRQLTIVRSEDGSIRVRPGWPKSA